MNAKSLIVFMITIIVVGGSLFSAEGKEPSIRGSVEHQAKEVALMEMKSEFNHLPTPTGPYKIGIKAFDLFDSSRKSLKWPEGRLVPINVYFPMEKGKHKLHSKVLEERAYDRFGALEIWKKLGVKVYGEHTENILPLKGTGKHPIVIFSHGNSCLMSDWAFLMEDLVSHGYIVITIQHQIYTDKKPPGRSSDHTALVIRNVLFVFDWLKENNADEFYETLNTKRVALIGYSMGANAMKLMYQHLSYGHNDATLLYHDDPQDVKECVAYERENV